MSARLIFVLKYGGKYQAFSDLFVIWTIVSE